MLHPINLALGKQPLGVHPRPSSSAEAHDHPEDHTESYATKNEGQKRVLRRVGVATRFVVTGWLDAVAVVPAHVARPIASIAVVIVVVGVVVDIAVRCIVFALGAADEARGAIISLVTGLQLGSGSVAI